MKSFINIDMFSMFRLLLLLHTGPRREDSIATAMTQVVPCCDLHQ